MAIVLGDFANFTDDSVFDGTLREDLSVQLDEPFHAHAPAFLLVAGYDPVE